MKGWQPTDVGNECRLRCYKWIGPALDDAALYIDGELHSLRIKHHFDELPLQMDRSGREQADRPPPTPSLKTRRPPPHFCPLYSRLNSAQMPIRKAIAPTTP
jgi:hypothetical protein